MATTAQRPAGPAGPADPAPTGDRRRDREATGRRILDAAQAILVAEGPAGLRINAVARQAGVDKQLIYRYFGGLDGLLAALGARLAAWWQERLLADAPATAPESYGRLIELLAVRLLTIMRHEPLAQQSALWELSGSSGTIAALTQARAQAMGAWILRARGDLRPPESVDAPAVNALIVSGISYLVLAGRTSDHVIGLAIREEATWARLESALRLLVRQAYPGT